PPCLCSSSLHLPPPPDIYTLSLHDALPISLTPDRGGHLVDEPSERTLPALDRRQRRTELALGIDEERDQHRYRRLCRVGRHVVAEELGGLRRDRTWTAALGEQADVLRLLLVRDLAQDARLGVAVDRRGVICLERGPAVAVGEA